jgi:hypothetical protein
MENKSQKNKLKNLVPLAERRELTRSEASR